MSELVVIGDVLLDQDLLGTAARLCPDAPVPVVDEREVRDRPGGAGLAATLAARDGADVTLVTALAEDEAAGRLRDLLGDRGFDVCDCADRTGTTSQKLRVRVNGQSLLRIDRGCAGSIGCLPPQAVAAIRGADAVLVADYGRGMADHPDVRRLLATRRRVVPVVWDPHPRSCDPLPGVTVVTPNESEARSFAASIDDPAGSTLADRARRADLLRTRWEVGAVAMTLGQSGALLAWGGGAPLVVPVEQPIDGADTCGAGDAFAVALASSLAEGHVLSSATEAAVAAAARFVEAGAGGSLAGSWAPSMRSGSSGARRTHTVVAAGGCFDVLHAGHVHLLTSARRLGDRLVVLMNSDASVRRLKGPGRPVQSEADRAAVLRSLRCVDEVVVFDEDTPAAALQRLRPDIFVKGSDYTVSDLPEAAVLREWNATAVTVPFLPGRSTSHILERSMGGTRVV